MKFFDNFKKKTMSVDTAGQYLLAMSMSAIDPFLNVALPDIANELNIDLGTFDINVLRSETVCICLWAAIKSLENDDYRLINAMQNKFLNSMGEDRRNQFEIFLKDRFNKYNEAWDENSGGNQSILVLRFLSEMFTDGEIDKRLFSMSASLYVTNLVFLTMKTVLDNRAKIKLIY